MWYLLDKMDYTTNGAGRSQSAVIYIKTDKPDNPIMKELCAVFPQSKRVQQVDAPAFYYVKVRTRSI